MKINELYNNKELFEYRKFDYLLHYKMLTMAKNEFEKQKHNNNNIPDLIMRIAINYKLRPRLLQNYLKDNNII